jgi:hypothetical protein
MFRTLGTSKEVAPKTIRNETFYDVYSVFRPLPQDNAVGCPIAGCEGSKSPIIAKNGKAANSLLPKRFKL